MGKKLDAKLAAARNSNGGRLTDTDKELISINHEVGEIRGELKVLKWLMGATMLVAVGHSAVDLLTPVLQILP
jgi:hypothetical protein